MQKKFGKQPLNFRFFKNETLLEINWYSSNRQFKVGSETRMNETSTNIGDTLFTIGVFGVLIIVVILIIFLVRRKKVRELFNGLYTRDQ